MKAPRFWKRKPVVHFDAAYRILFAPLGRYKDPAKPGYYTTHGMSLRRTIWIDPRKKDPVDTLVHELLHIQHWSWTENEVEIATEAWMRKATWKDKAKALRMLGRGVDARKEDMP